MRYPINSYDKKITGIFLLTLLISVLCKTAYADSSSQLIYGIDLDYRLSENGKTQYNALLKELEEQGLLFKSVIRPLRRSQASFKRDTKSCIFPATISAIKANDTSFDNQKLLQSIPIDQVSLRVFTQSEKPFVSSLDELEGKKVAVVNGLNPDIFFPDINMSVEFTANEEARVKMLDAGRIDAVLGFLPDVLLAAEALNLPPPIYDKELSVVSDEGVSFICHDTKMTRNFLKSTNKIIYKLKTNGKLRNILGPHSDIVPSPKL